MAKSYENHPGLFARPALQAGTENNRGVWDINQTEDSDPLAQGGNAESQQLARAAGNAQPPPKKVTITTLTEAWIVRVTSQAGDEYPQQQEAQQQEAQQKPAFETKLNHHGTIIVVTGELGYSRIRIAKFNGNQCQQLGDPEAIINAAGTVSGFMHSWQMEGDSGQFDYTAWDAEGNKAGCHIQIK